MGQYKILGPAESEGQPSPYKIQGRVPQPPQGSLEGAGSIPQDIGTALMNLFMSGGEKAMQLPEEISTGLSAFGEHPLKATGRAGGNVLASLLEGGKQLYNLPLNINTYLGSKGLPLFEQTAPYAEKFKIGNTGLQQAVLGKERPEDKLWQDIGTVASLIAGPEMAGVRVPAVTSKGILKHISADKAKYLGQAQRDFQKLFKDADEEFITHARPSKEVTQHTYDIVSNSQPKYHRSLQKYIENPTLENAHWAQSELGALERHLESISKKTGLTPTQINTLKAANEAKKGIREAMFEKNALGSNKELAERYSQLRGKYRDEVIPYTRLEEVSDFEAKKMTPKTAVKGLLSDEEFKLQLQKRYPGLFLRNPYVKKGAIYTGIAALAGHNELKDLFR